MKKIQTLNYRGLKHLLLSVLMLFTPLCMWGQTEYGLTVGGVQVTSANASNITGDAILSGSVSFDATSNTLTPRNHFQSISFSDD